MRRRWRWRQQHVVALAEAAVEAMGWVLKARWGSLLSCGRVLKAAVGQLTVLRTVDRTPRSARPTVFGLITVFDDSTVKRTHGLRMRE